MQSCKLGHTMLNAMFHHRKVFALSAAIIISSICSLLYYNRNVDTEHLRKEARKQSEVTDRLPEEQPVRKGYYVRHCITNQVLGEVPSDLETVPFEVSNETSSENEKERKSNFERIFKTKVWIPIRERRNDSRASGTGSTLDYAQEVISGLHSIISKLKRDLNVDRIRLLDIPCGDMVWMSRFLKTRDDVDYTGLDIVPDLINRHRMNYANQSNWKFRVQDIVRDGLSESFDLILCRMMLQHLLNKEALAVIKHFSESGSRFLLTTSFNRANVNSELPGAHGTVRPLNLEIPPFSLTPPVCLHKDGPKDSYHGQIHFLGLWKLPVRRVKFCGNFTVPFRVENLQADIFSCVNWS